MDKKILMVIAPADFRDEELFDTRDVLQESGLKTKVASTTRKVITGTQGGQVMPGIDLDKVDPHDWAAIVFVGGSGAKRFVNNDLAKSLAGEFKANNKIVAAICIAPVILAAAGILKGVRATVFESGRSDIEQAGANYVDQAVVQDGNIITANGPKAAIKFGEAIASALK